MSNRRFLIYSKPLSDYIYRELKKLNATQKSYLDDNELKFFRTDKTLYDFCHENPLDHLLFILTKAGKTWDLNLYDEEESVEQLKFSAVNQFQFPQKRIDVIETQAKENTHTLSSSEVMLSAYMCAQNCHTKVYHLSATSKEAVKRVSAISSIKIPFDEQIEKTKGAIDDLNRLLLNQLNSISWAEKTLGLLQDEIRVLCALFDKRDGAMTKQEIMKGVAMEDKDKYLKKQIDSLTKRKLIMDDSNHGPKSFIKGGKKINRLQVYYMITQEGIRKVMEYREYTHRITWKQGAF